MASRVAVERARVSVQFGSVIAALIVYFALTFPLRGWLVDDAAISMAYAANWSGDHGLVSQPGLPAVEGYSNFLWVVILALINLAGAMTPAALKFLSLACVGLSLGSLYSTCRPLMPEIARWSVLLLVAANSSIVTWTSSGLENPLTLLLACELLRILTLSWREGASLRSGIYAAVLVVAMGLTRPEGIAFATLPPLAFAKRRQWPVFTLYTVIVAILYSTFLAFRFATFHEWVPNTFFAKDAHSISPLNSLLNLANLLDGPFGSSLILLVLFALAYWCMKEDDRLAIPLCMMGVAAAVFALMPPDWMPDRRFGTAFVPPACVFAGVVLGSLNRWRTALLVATVATSASVSVYRLAAMYRNPTIPMAVVAQINDRFETIARERGLTHASLLMPDIGAALLKSNLRIYDLAGLTDRTIGRSLHSDKRRFHDYVFEDLKPTFIKVHGPWAAIAELDTDPRFRRDYVPIDEAIDPWLLAHGGVAAKSGDYIRKVQ